MSDKQIILYFLNYIIWKRNANSKYENRISIWYIYMCVLMSTLITLYTNLVGGDDEALQVLLEAKDEQKRDKVQILPDG